MAPILFLDDSDLATIIGLFGVIVLLALWIGAVLKAGLIKAGAAGRGFAMVWFAACLLFLIVAVVATVFTLVAE